jgi:predicted RNase H-like HicB family nuclease
MRDICNDSSDCAMISDDNIRSLSPAEKEAVNILFTDLIVVSKSSDNFIAEEYLTNLAEQGSTEEEAVDNLKREIEEHIFEIKKIVSRKKKGLNYYFRSV